MNHAEAAAAFSSVHPGAALVSTRPDITHAIWDEGDTRHVVSFVGSVSDADLKGALEMAKKKGKGGGC